MSELPRRFGHGDIETFADHAKSKVKRLCEWREHLDDKGIQLMLVGQMISYGKYVHLITLDDVKRWLKNIGHRTLSNHVSHRIRQVRHGAKPAASHQDDTMQHEDIVDHSQYIMKLEDVATVVQKLLYQDPGMDTLKELEKVFVELRGEDDKTD